MIEWILVILLLIIALIYLAWKYSGLKDQIGDLKGQIEDRSREIFEKWRSTELETQANAIAESKAVEKANMFFQDWKTKELELRTNERANLLFQEWRQKEEEKIRKDAIERSLAVVKGKVTEHIIPFFPDFEYNPKDARFIGTPIDLIVFDGLNEGDLRKVIFVEVKTGKTASLSIREKQVRNCIDNKNVIYRIIHHELSED
jgi:predicted Holliday junction resolvase-like endonuclease